MSVSKVLNFFVRVAERRDIPVLVKIINDAFMADAFFKKPAFALRTSIAQATELMFEDEASGKPAENRLFLCAMETESQSMVGVIYVEWDAHHHHGHFGRLSVIEEYNSRGVGRRLVSEAEKVIKHMCGPGPVSLRIPIINVRPELKGWYERQGYEMVGEEPFEAPEILNGVLDVKFQIMVKVI